MACLLYYFYATDVLQLLALAFVFSLLLVIAIADYLYLLIPDRFQLLLLFGVVFRQAVLPVADWPAAFISFFVIFPCCFSQVSLFRTGSGRRCQTAFDFEPHFRVGAHLVHHLVGQFLRRLLFSAHPHGERQLLAAQIAVWAIPRRFCCRGALRANAADS